jgi:hypothetical protein
MNDVSRTFSLVAAHISVSDLTEMWVLAYSGVWSSVLLTAPLSLPRLRPGQLSPGQLSPIDSSTSSPQQQSVFIFESVVQVISAHTQVIITTNDQSMLS